MVSCTMVTDSKPNEYKNITIHQHPVFVHMDHIASSNQCIFAPEYDNFGGFLDEKCMIN